MNLTFPRPGGGALMKVYFTYDEYDGVKIERAFIHDGPTIEPKDFDKKCAEFGFPSSEIRMEAERIATLPEQEGDLDL